MTIAILATGDEIIHGDTLNTNSFYLAQQLSFEGLPLGLQLTCSDKKTEIIRCLDFLAKDHNILILIGGLGPTTDDLTRFALAEYTGDPLVQHAEARTFLTEKFKQSKVALNEGNLQQCLFPQSAKLLPNPHGSAMGCSYSWNNKLFILLPGPPRECLPMFQNEVFPSLLQTQHSSKQIIRWRIFGLAESEIAHILEEALAEIDCQTGYRLDTPYIEFKVKCAGSLVETVKAIINPILAPHVISTVEKKASDLLRDLIISLNEPITLLDDVTGGLLQTLLIKPGTFHLIHTHPCEKTKLQFHLHGLEAYWMSKPSEGNTQLTIDYESPKVKESETHQLPFRSPLVVHYAAEWLCFRLFHLINQLHQ